MNDSHDAPESSNATTVSTPGSIASSIDLSNCRYCSGITLESLSRFGGYKHASNRASLVRSAQKCRFCSLLFRKDRTRHSVPLYLALERAGTSEDDEIDQVCLTVRHGKGTESQRYEGEGLTFFLYTDPGDHAEDFGITARQALSNTSSDQSFETAGQWIEDCMANHICHKRLPLKEHENEFQPWPSRLIDVLAFGSHLHDDVRLVDNDGSISEHVCLSYVWGKSKTFTTTSRSLRLRKTRISFNSIPMTFKDAVIITRRHGKRYLWIDSLCILQDQRSDWEQESVKMGAIYSNAFVTIAADAGSDSDSGCFNVKSHSQVMSSDTPPFELVMKSKGRQSTVYVWDAGKGGQKSAPSEIDASPLAERGWVCQERILSPRILHYTKSQLFWECRQALLAEDNLRPWTIWTSQPGTVCSLARNLYGTTTDPVGRAYLLSIWYNNVVSQSYSRRKLTLPDDKLTAISGIARAFGRHFLTTYISGLWLLDLSWGLSWRRRGASIRPKLYRAPSFSWASLDAPVEWPLQSNLQTSRLTLIDVQTATTSSDPYGRVNSSFLTISGYTSQAYIGVRKQISAGGVDVTWQLLGERKQWLGNAFMDIDDDGAMEDQTNLQLVQYIVLSHNADTRDSQVLLYRIDNDEHAVRIGSGEILGLESPELVFVKDNLKTLQFV